MELDQKLLINLQREINYLIINNDLLRLPKIYLLLEDYCKLNNISESDLKKLIKLSIKHGGKF